MKNLTDIGFISKASGFHGEVVFISEGPALPSGARFLFFMLEGKPVPFLLEEKKEKGGNLLLKFEDVNDEAEAKKLAGLRLYAEVPAGERDESELSWDELTGYEVVDTTYGSLGPLLSVEEFPSQMLGRCSVNGKEVLFPLLEEFLESVDDEKKILRLHLPEGLLNIYLDKE
jgi:16S rRNA processing protein RimM